MMRNIMTKTQYKKIFGGIIKNFTICSASKHSQKRKTSNEKFVRLDENSLQPRILKYFNDSVNNEQTYNNIVINKRDCCDNLSVLKTSELCLVILSLGDPTFRRGDFSQFLKYLDKECCTRLNELTTNEIFNYLHNFMICLPHLITKLSFYKQSMYKLNFTNQPCTKIELLQLCFYVALQKRTKGSQIVLKDCLKKCSFQYLNHLNINDLAILCNSTYKTSTKIEYRKIIDKIINTLYNNLNILSDTTYFITLIKSIRQNKSQDEELLTTISNAIFFNNTVRFYSFTANSHILALYADALHYDNNLFKLLTDSCIQYLKESGTIKSRNEHFSRQIRVKDIARLLWSISYINCEDFDRTIITNYIVPLLQGYINVGELERNIEYFVDSILSMVIMGYMPEINFFTSVVTKNMIAHIYGKGKKRCTARMNLLLTCVRLENSQILPSSLSLNKPPPWNQTNQMRNRPFLKTILNALNNISSAVDVKKFEFTSAVPHLNIIGITGYKDGQVRLYVELIDELMQVKNAECTPYGFMKLKIRLLQTFNKPVLVIFKENLDDLKQQEIETYLLRKIKLLFVNS